jgi:malonyl-CoA/methylmalonyl-CoA synthetase
VTLPGLFEPTFRNRAHAIALEWQNRSYTFGEIETWSHRVAHALLARGLKHGDRLALYLPNRPEYIVLVLACLEVGVIVVPINILYKERDAGHILRDSQPRAVVVEDTAPASGIDTWPLDALMSEGGTSDDRPAAERISDDTPAALIYTSGTTGAAKGAVLTHGNFAANASTLAQAWRFSAKDRLLLALPLFHVHGLANGVMCWLASGCLVRLLPRFDQRTAADEFLAFRPTVFFGVPTMYVRLLDLEGRVAQRIGAEARVFVSGSAPLAAHVLEAFASRFGHRILERYGMTETLITLSNPYEGERRAGTVGLPLPRVETRIVSRGADAADDETASCGCGRRPSVPVTGTGPTRPRRPSLKDGSTPATSRVAPPMATSRSTGERATSSSPAGSTSTRARSRRCCSSIRPLRKRRSRAFRMRRAVRCPSRLSFSTRKEAATWLRWRRIAGSSSHLSKCRAHLSHWRRCPARHSGRCRKACSWMLTKGGRLTLDNGRPLTGVNGRELTGVNGRALTSDNPQTDARQRPHTDGGLTAAD